MNELDFLSRVESTKHGNYKLVVHLDGCAEELLLDKITSDPTKVTCKICAAKVIGDAIQRV